MGINRPAPTRERSSVSTPFFSDHHAEERRSSLGALEERQALLIEVLLKAGGEPVSYHQLRASGVELPASIVSELELAGVPVQRCGAAGGGRGVRLDPSWEPSRAREVPTPADAGLPTQPLPAAIEDSDSHPVWPPARERLVAAVRDAAESAVREYGRWIAPAALLLALGLIVALVTTASSGGGTTTPRSSAHRHSTAETTTGSATAHPHGSAPTVTSAPPTPISPAAATHLEAHGHDLLDAGRYASAIPVLRDAVAATGERLGGCVEPASADCLTYAYALYDLGRALRLNGQAAAAVPILERRLEIDNQRPAVLAELSLAQSEAG